MSSLYMTPREVAQRWGCSASHVRRLCASERLPAMRLGLDKWRIAVSAVEAYERGQTATSAHADEAPKPEAPRREERAVATIDGLELPADYRPVFPELWLGHEPQDTKKRPSAATQRR